MERHSIERETDKFNLEREREKIFSTKTAPLRAKGSNNVTLLINVMCLAYLCNVAAYEFFWDETILYLLKKWKV